MIVDFAAILGFATGFGLADRLGATAVAGSADALALASVIYGLSVSLDDSA